MLRRNILIFHAAALGDFVLTWPLALALGRVCAQSRVFYVTASQKGKLAERVLGVESRDAESGWQHLFSDPAKLPDPVRRTLEGAQLIVNLVARPGDAWIDNVRHATTGGAEILTLSPRPHPEQPGVHAAQFLLDQLAGHKVLHAGLAQILKSISERGVSTALKGGPTVLLHPGAGAREKCWPVPRWLELIAALRSAGQPVRVLLGEVERERFSPADLAALEKSADCAFPADYGDLLSHLATAKAFIGNDSGPGHLAGIIGLPTTVLFGPTSPEIWKPLGPRVTTLSKPSLAEITPDEVLATLPL